MIKTILMPFVRFKLAVSWNFDLYLYRFFHKRWSARLIHSPELRPAFNECINRLKFPTEEDCKNVIDSIAKPS